MLARALHRLHQTVLLTVLTVALIATGFGHRMPTAEDNALTAVLLAGGTAADFCGDLAPMGKHADANCQACQITAAADLPPAITDLQDLDLVFLAEVTAPRESRAPVHIFDPARPAQAPPVA